MSKVVELNGRNNTSPNYILEDKTSGPKYNMYAIVGCHFKACTNRGHQFIHFINKFLLFLDNFPTIKNSFTQLYPVCNNFILWKVLINEVTASVQWFWSNLLTFSCFYTFQFILNDLSLETVKIRSSKLSLRFWIVEVNHLDAWPQAEVGKSVEKFWEHPDCSQSLPDIWPEDNELTTLTFFLDFISSYNLKLEVKL